MNELCKSFLRSRGEGRRRRDRRPYLSWVQVEGGITMYFPH